VYVCDICTYTRMHACVYVSMYVIHVRVHICVYYVCMYMIYIYIYMHVCNIYVRTYVRMYVYHSIIKIKKHPPIYDSFENIVLCHKCHLLN